MLPVIITISIFVTMAWYTVFYILSVGPAHMEKRIGERAWQRCAVLRKISFAGMFLGFGAEILYAFFPLEIGLPRNIIPGTMGWIICVGLGILFTVGGSLLIKAVSTVATDSYVPRKENQMFGGIYDRIRHPQAIADVAYWLGLAFFLNSLFILLVTLLWIPLNFMIALFEERDLKLRFGQAYRDYMMRVPRFIPRLGK